MAAEYVLRVFSPAGVPQAEIVDYAWLTYSKRVNQPGYLQFELWADHPARQYLTDRAQVEVWRSNKALGLPPYCDFVGLCRDFEERQSDSGVDTLVADVPGVMTMLAWRWIAYYANVEGRTRFANIKAETLMKTLVDLNIGAGAVTTYPPPQQRMCDGTSGGQITVEADAGRGNTIATWACAWRPLLEELQDIAEIAGGDFDLIKVAANTYEFRFYPGQRGTDRTAGPAKHVFSVALGNMKRPSLRRRNGHGATVAIVAGQGVESGRAVLVSTGNGYSASNKIEVFVNASHVDATQPLQPEADLALRKERAFWELAFDVQQVAGSYYGLHYDLGDLVTAQYRGYSAAHKISAVTVGFQQDGQETVRIEMSSTG